MNTNVLLPFLLKVFAQKGYYSRVNTDVLLPFLLKVLAQKGCIRLSKSIEGKR